MDRKALVYKGWWPDITCCDQVLRILPDGTWLCLFMTGGQTEPAPENHVVLCRSTDRGETWGPAESVLRLPDRACTMTEVHQQGGTLTVHVQIHRGRFDDWTNHTISSADGGRTWSAPVPFAALPRRAKIRNTVESSWGERFMPFQHYLPTGDPAASVLEDGSFASPRVGVLHSADQGATWRTSATIAGQHWAEPALAELRDGRLAMLIRSSTGRLWRSDSADRGRTWSDPVQTGIPNPSSKVRLWRLGDGRIAMVHNPNPALGHPNSKPYASVNRNPLALWISDDDLETWSWRRDLTDFPGHLAYPDGVLDEAGGYIHLVFDYNRHDVIYWGAKLP